MSALEGWRKKTLRELVTINYGRSPANILVDDGSYPVVGTGGIDRSGNDYLYDGESVILGRKGTIDRVYFTKGRFWTIDTAYYLTGFGELVPRWLYYALQSIDFRQMNEATGVPSLSRDLLYKIEIPTPPKLEQAKIAEILTTVDQAIEQTEALIAKQQRIKTGLMQDLLTRGIDEHGNLRSEQTHKFKDSPLGRIPMEWEIVQLSHFVKRLDAGVSVNSDDKACGSGQLGVLKTSALNKGRFLPEQNKSVLKADENRVRVSPIANTILISRMNTPDLVGESGFVDKNYPNLFLPDRIWMTVFDKGKEKTARWLSFVMASPQARIYLTLNATGTSGSMKNLPKSSLFKMPIRAPKHLKEQQNIAGVLDRHIAETEQIDRQLLKLKSLKTALMQDLLTGKKRVAELLNNFKNVKNNELKY
jgi:type I restriction enzyme, S subunit